MNEDYKTFLQGAKKKNITPHFTLFEVCNSATAIAKNIDNRPTAQVIVNATALCKNVLEKIREHFGKPITITNMYRCPKLNDAVGGAKDEHGNPKSQHCYGQAADFVIAGISDLDIVNYIRKYLIFDQLILEQANGAHWVHISFSLVKNRRQCLKYNGKAYTAF